MAKGGRAKKSNRGAKRSSGATKDSGKAKAWRFFWVGTGLTLFDYAVYEVIVLLFLGGNTGLASIISGSITTVVAFFAHSRITWKARKIGRSEIIKFFVWTILTMWLIRPLLTRGAELLTPLYQFAYGICQWIGINFSYEFVRTTGVFAICTAVIMILNYCFYDRFVFSKAGKM